ncbi:AT hook domain-containing protein [Colletotrichum lupini]|uniref:AT hook domain-containing protein n=1 Tax=Colletotrichum lupini TaxID=145971 RepID=A0A9Q8SI13_9PEZI|nr:AT hook domain-containing protein [Colletotrichum lupini]UQC76862.1 AT hook domain-containing protein [Colletotrichum lupini]
MTFDMMKLWEGDGTAASAKNMALELLGVMSAAVSKLRSHVRKVTYSMDGSDSNELSRYLSEPEGDPLLFILYLDGKAAQPHVAIFYVIESDDEAVRGTLSAAWNFMQRHAVPSILISNDEVYHQLTAMWDDRINQHAMNICVTLDLLPQVRVIDELKSDMCRICPNTKRWIAEFDRIMTLRVDNASEALVPEARGAWVWKINVDEVLYTTWSSKRAWSGVSSGTAYDKTVSKCSLSNRKKVSSGNKDEGDDDDNDQEDSDDNGTDDEDAEEDNGTHQKGERKA